jgi:hypothetical protein
VAAGRGAWRWEELTRSLNKLSASVIEQLACDRYFEAMEAAGLLVCRPCSAPVRDSMPDGGGVLFAFRSRIMKLGSVGVVVALLLVVPAMAP